MTPGGEWLGWSEPGRTTLEIRTGGWRTRQPLYREATAPCRAGCPAGEPIARWVERARAGDWAGAWALIREENPFPAVMGRVCAHPCEAACNRGSHDGAVAINALEQFVGDWGLRQGRPGPTAPSRAERVAVVGGGPAGLGCAYHLARLGYRVSVFEARPELGGLLRYGIPEYRLPRAVLDREIELILGLGIETVTGRRLGVELDWGHLRGFDAAFLATGAGVPLGVAVPGEESPWVTDALAFLHRVNAGGHPPLGSRVVVVGGGSTAMDAARSARRLGAAPVTVLALESREAMPAIPEEVSQALAEGVEIVNGMGVLGFAEEAGGRRAVTVGSAGLERQADGSVRPVFFPGPRAVMEAHTVLLAVGQRVDLGALPPGLVVAGGLVAAAVDGATSVDRLFAGGDLASRTRTASHAIGAGARAARAIHARLAGVSAAAADAGHVVDPSEIGRHAFPPARRAARLGRPAAARVHGFSEVLEGLDAAAARAEAARCFTCGHCTACDVCLLACPDTAIRRLDGAYVVSLDHCKGCGLCARECPRGALAMVADR
ncbi:MAG: FAD-dependent oxidoreductase [Candidatus Rokubacteria bacterium]|nr:FAD-dependent oxidoreductase [Candidatus Rokubacteria bacterium]